MFCKFSSCKIYYCKDIISKNFTVFLQDFLLATCLDIKSCIAEFFLQDSFLHLEILQEIVLSCKIYFLQDVCIKNLAHLARYLQVLAQSCKTFLHGRDRPSCAQVKLTDPEDRLIVTVRLPGKTVLHVP